MITIGDCILETLAAIERAAETHFNYQSLKYDFFVARAARAACLFLTPTRLFNWPISI
jgi:hypothetical protein